MPRSLSEQEFTALYDAVVKAAPPNLSEPAFARYYNSAMAGAVGEAENLPAPKQGSSVWTALKTYGSDLNPMPVLRAMTDTMSLITGIPSPYPGEAKSALQSLLQAHLNTAKQGIQDIRQGRIVEGTARVGASAVPFIGPLMNKAGTAIGEGRTAEGVAHTAALLTPSAIAAGRNLVTGIRVPAVRPNPNVIEAAAVDFGRQQGIPVDAGTATGSQFIKNVQKKAASTWGGATTVELAKTAQADNLTRVGSQLADQANPPLGPNQPSPALRPTTAGETVRTALQRQIDEHNATADQAYERFRQLAGSRTINLAAVKAQLKPLYQELQRRYPIAQQQASPGLKALQNIIEGPDLGTLADADANLSAIKAAARSEMPALRTVSQGVAAQAVRQLDASVRATAAQGGPQALRALEEGRAATTAKWKTADVLDMLSDEPRKLFDQLTVRKDGGIERLRSVAKLAPEQMPNVGRAVLEDMLDTATAEGGFGHADKLWADWQKLGPETKQVLFPKLTDQLDSFFLLAKRLGENPNPSGTAQVLTATQLMVGVPGYALAKLLYSPKFVGALTRGARLPVNASAVAKTAALTEIVNAAKAAGVSLPMGAGDQAPTPNTTSQEMPKKQWQ